ncbi:MAG: hypothetical protein A3J28_10190 [Acidobacteria bacterium RIFCSPLOWO2_12_FULL_60_22]|nr:MAG: hypothetical protein A3J28_10190 [Acidobacteria bacterium RIFCSPLOWO2_12_FULL_60_22]
MKYAPLVILSEAKNLLVANMLKQKQMLRFAQNDKQGGLLYTYLWDTTLEVSHRGTEMKRRE